MRAAVATISFVLGAILALPAMQDQSIWYTAPYDVTVVPINTGGPQAYRRCAIERYRGDIDRAGARYDWIEIDDACLVKVHGPRALQTLIQADADFVRHLTTQNARNAMTATRRVPMFREAQRDVVLTADTEPVQQGRFDDVDDDIRATLAPE